MTIDRKLVNSLGIGQSLAVSIKWLMEAGFEVSNKVALQNAAFALNAAHDQAENEYCRLARKDIDEALKDFDKFNYYPLIRRVLYVTNISSLRAYKLLLRSVREDILDHERQERQSEGQRVVSRASRSGYDYNPIVLDDLGSADSDIHNEVRQTIESAQNQTYPIEAIRRMCDELLSTASPNDE